jgi:hypothetical protein
MCTSSHFVVTRLTVRQVGWRGYYERSSQQAGTVERATTSNSRCTYDCSSAAIVRLQNQAPAASVCEVAHDKKRCKSN